MQGMAGAGWPVAVFGCGAFCLGVALAVGVGLVVMASGICQRQQQLLSTISVVLVAIGTLLFVLAMA